MVSFTSRFIIIGFAAALALPVCAQTIPSDQATPESKGVATGQDVGHTTPTNKAVATVRIDGGVIMLSEDGGPFVTAATHQAVISGERLMVAKDSKATVIYNDGCEQKYEKAGVYKIEPGCKMPVAFIADGGAVAASTIPTSALMLGIGGGIVGGVAIAKVIDDRNCDCKCPISR